MFRIVAFALAFSGLCLCALARADDAEVTAVALVEKLGGTVVRDEKAPGKPVTQVWLIKTKVTDAELKELAIFKNLIGLVLIYTKVTDVGLKELATLKNLVVLELGNTKVTDAGLKELAALKNLEILNLTDTEVTDAGLRAYALNLTGIAVTTEDFF